MRCDDVRKRILRYVMGKLPDIEMVAMDDHLDGCDACVKAVNDYLTAHGLAESDPEKDELLRLMRIPMPSPEKVQEGVGAVLRSIRMAEAETAAHSLTPTVMSHDSVIVSWTERPHALGRWVTVRWTYGLAAIAVVGLVVFVWNREARFRALEQRFTILTAMVDALKRQNDSLRWENASLKRQVAQASVKHERTRQILAEKQRKLEERIAQLQREKEALKAQLSQSSTPKQVLVALRDKSGMVTVNTDGTVRLAGNTALPPSLAQTVHKFVTTGTVTPTKPVLIAMATLRSDAKRPSECAGRGNN